MENRPLPEEAASTRQIGTQTSQYLLLGAVGGMLFPIVGTVLKTVQLGLPVGLGSIVAVQSSEPLLWIIDTAPLFLGLVAALAGRRQDLALEVNQELREREAELSAIRSGLEQSIAERTQELDRRNSQMRDVIQFARQIAEVGELTPLLDVAVESIGNRFGRLDADLYLLDGSGQSAVLRASSSAAGKELLQDGFRVGVGDQNPVGRVLRRGKLLMMEQASATQTPAAAGLAAGSRSQITLPLIARGRTIGALDLHIRGAQPPAASEIETFQLLSDQLAAVIENVRLVTQTRATVNQLESLAAQGARSAWQDYLSNRTVAFRYTPAGVSPMAPGKTTEEAGTLSLPVMLRGQTIGLMKVRGRTSSHWTEADRDLAEKVASQVALALENLRLLEQTRQRAAQEQIVSEVASRLNRSLEVDAVLQAAAREFAALPEVAEAEVMLNPISEREVGPRA